jgi:hypothetical protein
MEGSKTLFCSLKFPRACGSISLKFIDNLSTPQQQGSPALASIARFTYISPPSAYRTQLHAAASSKQEAS